MGAAQAGQIIMNSMGTLLGLLVAVTLLSSAHAFDCKRYTVKQIDISGNNTGNMSEIFRTTKDTQRCSAVYKLDNTTCSSMQLTCGRWYLPNKDTVQCRRGDKFLIKVDDSKPRVFCEHETHQLLSSIQLHKNEGLVFSCSGQQIPKQRGHLQDQM